MSAAVSELAKAYPAISLEGDIKQQAEDFVVEELLDIPFSDDGEFDWLWVEKRGQNTDFVARQLARHANLASKAVSYSGMKDRHAVTRQWFCVHTPGKQRLGWQGVAGEGWRVTRAQRHRQKLRRGTHSGNRFTLLLRNVKGESDAASERLETLSREGFPNYFAEQRFGIDGGNLAQCRRWFEGGFSPKRFQRGILLSSARSFLFNEVLSRRVELGCWNSALGEGELFALRDSGSVFSDSVDDRLRQRLQVGDIHPTGPLFGKVGKTTVGETVAQFEDQVIDRHPLLRDGLLRFDASMARRSLRVMPVSLVAEWPARDQLELSFSLPKGCFATALVRELLTPPVATTQENNST